MSRERLRVIWREFQRGSARNLSISARFRNNDWKASCHRFDHGKAEGFAKRGKDEYVQTVIDFRDVLLWNLTVIFDQRLNS